MRCLKFTKKIALLAAVMVANHGLSSPLSAQLSKFGEVVLSTTDSAMGVALEGQTAFASLFTSGVQVVVDLSVLSTPSVLTTFNPAYGDQWNEPIVYGSKLVSGNRFGGLNLWDVSVPASPSGLDDTNTNYHFDGLDILDNGIQPLLFYSEHNASGNPAGLVVFDLSGCTLNQIGSSLLPGAQRDGRFLISTFDNWVYQLDGGAGSTRPLNLNVYDVNVPAAPVHVTMFNMGNTFGNYASGTDLELDPHQRILYAACYLDGLRIIDIGVRSSPVVVNTLAATGYAVRELCYVDGTVFMIATVRFPNGQWRFRILDCTVPTNPVPIGNWLGDPNYTIRDLCVASVPGGPAVILVGDDGSGVATLQVWL